MPSQSERRYACAEEMVIDDVQDDEDDAGRAMIDELEDEQDDVGGPRIEEHEDCEDDADARIDDKRAAEMPRSNETKEEYWNKTYG